MCSAVLLQQERCRLRWWLFWCKIRPSAVCTISCHALETILAVHCCNLYCKLCACPASLFCTELLLHGTEDAAIAWLVITPVRANSGSWWQITECVMYILGLTLLL
jgi:hypothetical protein